MIQFFHPAIALSKYFMNCGLPEKNRKGEYAQ